MFTKLQKVTISFVKSVCLYGKIWHPLEGVWYFSQKEPTSCNCVVEFIIPLFFLIDQHVSGDTPPIIRSSKTVIAASGFTYVSGCQQLSWLSHRSECCPSQELEIISVTSALIWIACASENLFIFFRSIQIRRFELVTVVSGHKNMTWMFLLTKVAFVKLMFIDPCIMT